MKMSEEMAVRLHRMMWSDMQKELGDCPSEGERLKYKEEWIKKHFPDEKIANNCWLCEYASSVSIRSDCGGPYCKCCPISWPKCHCNTLGFSYAKEPISEILALPAKNGKKCTNDSDLMMLAYCNAKMELAKASGLSEAAATIDHIAEIKKKEDRSVMEVLENFSGLKGEGCWIIDHVKAIQKKAVEEYFDKTPGAKLATMDVDQAFKQYADEQKAPIFKQLSKESGLSENNHSVCCHIEWIKNKARQEGRDEKDRQLKQVLSASSGLLWANEVVKHIAAIDAKAHEDMSSQILRAVDAQEAKIRMVLADESGLDPNRPVDDHIREIVRNSMEAGAAEERDRIQSKIEELLS